MSKPDEMDVRTTPLPGVLVVEPDVFADHRGHLFEAYHEERYDQAGIAGPFVQDNLSRSRRGVLRGLHFEAQREQSKLVWVVAGEIFDVAVDVRPDSPTFAHWFGMRLSGANHRQIYIPPGFAHGFCVLSELADVIYKSTTLFAPEYARGVIWNDPTIRIEWPLADPVLSERDASLPTLQELVGT
jgi:dTDP-4-dehydrorhamnose 3,5-epimerase